MLVRGLLVEVAMLGFCPSQAQSRPQLAQPRICNACQAAHTAAARGVAVCSAYSQVAALQPADLSVVTGICNGYLQDSTAHQQQHAGSAFPEQQQLGHIIRRCSTFSQLLVILQQQGNFLTAEDVTAVLYKAAMLAKSAKRVHAMGASAHGSRSMSCKLPFCAEDMTKAQQIVGDCLQLLIQVNQQLTAQHLSNCLLSLSVLCSRGGPAAAVFNGSSNSTGASLSTATRPSNQTQQQQQRGPGVLQQLIAPVSSRALDQLLEAAAPQHQLQQLLELTCTTSSNSRSSSLCLRHAELHQLVNTMYGLAVLRLRPAPQVVQQLLLHTQQHLGHLQQQQSQSMPKLLSQLLWAVATLQIQLPADWLSSFWCASQPVLPLYSAQDVANTAWAAATLRLQPPPIWLSGLMSQAQAVSQNLTGQGLANTLWGLAVIDSGPMPMQLLLQLLQCAVAAAKRGRLEAQNLANIIWAIARNSRAYANNNSSSRNCILDPAVHTALQQLLSSSSALASSFHPQDWSNILWACGQLQLQPGTSLLQQLWRKTPAGFNTSLNPHSMTKALSHRNHHQATSPTAWSPQALANCLWGCARIQAQPTRVWLQGFEAASVSLMSGFSPQLLSNTLWAFSQLGHTPSDAWLQQYWQHAGVVLQDLQTAVTAAAAADEHHDYEQQHTTWHDGELQGRGMNAAAAQVVMVMQAAAKLGVLPPVHWVQQATAAIKAAVLVSNTSQEGLTTMKHQQQVSVRTLAAFLHSVGRLEQTAVTSASSGSCPLLSAGDAEDLLQHALGCRLGVSSISGNDTNQQHSTAVPHHLSSLETLLLLAALPLLPLSSRQAASQAAALLIARCYQILADSCSDAEGVNSKQLVEFTVAAARAVQHCCRRRVQSSSSAYLHPVHTTKFWHLVDHLLPQSGAVHLDSSSSSSSNRLLLALCSKLEQHLSEMSAADISRALGAVAQLHRSSRSSMRNSDAHALSSFSTAAGNAVCDHLAVMSPHQRAAAAAALAQLGYSPTTTWLELLLLHSGCQLSSDTCSMKDKLLLLQSLPVLLQRHQQHHHQQRTGAALRAPHQLHVEGVTGWLQDWLGESVRFLHALNPQQLLVTAAAMDKLLKYQHHQQQSVLLPVAWRASYLSAVVRLLPELSAAELVSLLSSAHRLQLRPSHEWCAAVATEAAARTSTLIGQQQQQQQSDGLSSNSSSRSIKGRLKVHHVGLLAYTFKMLGYKAPWSIRQQLLNHVLAECRGLSSSSSSTAVVTPNQVMHLMLLLPLSGWYPSQNWLRCFKRSRPVRQLRLHLSKKRHRGSWRILEVRFRCWEQIRTTARSGRWQT